MQVVMRSCVYHSRGRRLPTRVRWASPRICLFSVMACIGNGSDSVEQRAGNCEREQQAEIGQVAGVIVQEATHQRLKRSGIKTIRLRQARIEAACAREQPDFLRKLGEHGEK
jgi:hypothetical protein